RLAVASLLMDTGALPVGTDQVHHVEYAAAIAAALNHLYRDTYRFKIPVAITPNSEQSQPLPGLDGRKMSKSYDNTIPLFLPENKLKKLIRRIPTDSTPVEEPKDPDSSAVFQLLQQLADAETVADTRKRLSEGGLGWGELKNQLFEVANAELGPLRERYEELIQPDSDLDRYLAEGAVKARERASRVLRSAR